MKPQEESFADKYKTELLFVAGLILIGAVFFYGYRANTGLRDALSSTTEQLNTQLTKIQEDYAQQIRDAREETKLLENMVLRAQEEDQKKITALQKTIDRVEQESAVELAELKDELENIDVQSGDFSAIVDDVLPSVVSVLTDDGQGSGVFVIGGGFIVTNVHVINGASVIRVYTYDNKIFPAVLLGYEPVSDIAVLKINSTAYDPLEFGDSDAIKVGQRAIALGNPGGLDFSVTEGIISGVDRKTGDSDIGYIQIDVPINPGNSGGPLVNSNKEIIGINNWKLGGGFESVGFAIPSNVVEDVVDEVYARYLE